MGAVSAFTTGNYHCKPLMTDVIVIHKNKNKVKKSLHFSQGLWPTKINNLISLKAGGSLDQKLNCS